MNTNTPLPELTLGKLIASLLIALSFLCAVSNVLGAEEKIFSTGIQAQPRYFSVAPNGDYLVFDTKKPLGGMRLLDLRSGEMKAIPAERDRQWEMGRLSRDGKQMVAVSVGMPNGKYNMDDMKIILVDPKDWSWHEISPAGDGVKITPFFSPDGERVFYFKGIARTEGATPASKYDLYVIDLAARKEERLTNELYYQVSAGDVSGDNKTIYFSKIGGKPFPSNQQTIPQPELHKSNIVAINSQTKELRPTSYFDLAKFVQISEPRLDKAGHMYFFGITPAEKGQFVFSIFKHDKNMETARRLADISNWSRFDIAKSSGDIYVSDTRADKIVFRRLAINANQ